MKREHELWVDYIKVFACILVVFGHLFQSLVKANILPNNQLYKWFNTTIYYFHVPLFFICSGYLYQRYSVVNSWGEWKEIVWKKFIVLGIPYFVFSLITWLLKTVFAGFVNSEIRGIVSTLFLHPTSPYWYLYILFFLFVLTPTTKNSIELIVLLFVSLLMKIIAMSNTCITWQIYAIEGICSYEIWFVLGMVLAVIGPNKIKKRALGALLGIVFLIISCKSYAIDNTLLDFAMVALSCTSIIMLFVCCREQKMLSWIAGFTMPIFLMHTLFAAPVRMLLSKVGADVFIQILIGIIISFAGPVIAMILLEEINLDWIIYPGKLLRGGNRRG